MKPARYFLSLLAMVILVALLASGQSVPQLINYQGRLTNAAGIPLEGTSVDLTFRFYSAETAGDLYLTVSQTNVQVSKGIYNVLIGSGTITPGTESTLAAVFQKHAEVWMGVKVGADPEMTPRARITSVPYAMKVDMRLIGDFLAKPDWDGDGYPKTGEPGDCNDGDASINPGAEEVCSDGYDNDCDGDVDESDADCCTDGDLDLFFGQAGCGTAVDCDDLDPLVYPGAPELCDGIDNQCSGDPGYGQVDEGCENTWTWMSGGQVINQSGVYGTKGTPSASNVPGARINAVSWKDSSGNLWMFGGWGFAESGGAANLNDLWKYDGTNWTWMSGAKTTMQNGIYGTLGIPDPANVPGARYTSAVWIDPSNNLWLWGGRGYGEFCYGDLNDLWKYDGTYWTFLDGSSGCDAEGYYGTKGVADPSNEPPARHSVMYSKGAAGIFWLFGGYDYSQYNIKNDLWNYNGTNWTWVSGSDQWGSLGIYGTLGIPDSANMPGARARTFSWTDLSANLWVFGGEGLAEFTYGYLNDLWRYDGENWTWMSGSKLENQPGLYGTKGFPAASNIPGGRIDPSSWKDSNGYPGVFGGLGFGASGSSGSLNDLWIFDGANWTWISGSDTVNQTGVYGTKGVPGSANIPGGRRGAVSWSDSSGNLWIFGGEGYDSNGQNGYLNDLWKFEDNR